jgi:hypothetical protein
MRQTQYRCLCLSSLCRACNRNTCFGRWGPGMIDGCMLLSAPLGFQMATSQQPIVRTYGAPAGGQFVRECKSFFSSCSPAAHSPHEELKRHAGLCRCVCWQSGVHSLPGY